MGLQIVLSWWVSVSEQLIFMCCPFSTKAENVTERSKNKRGICNSRITTMKLSDCAKPTTLKIVVTTVKLRLS